MGDDVAFEPAGVVEVVAAWRGLRPDRDPDEILLHLQFEK